MKKFLKECLSWDTLWTVLYLSTLLGLTYMLGLQNELIKEQGHLINRQSRVIQDHGMGELLNVKFRIDGMDYLIQGNAYAGFCYVYSLNETQSCLLKWEEL